MGSFNLACVATNTPLLYGDRCVAVRVKPITDRYGRGDPGDSISSAHFICASPVRGAYGDYGYVEIDGGGTVGDGDDDTGEYMVFHEYAYDLMRETYELYRAEDDAWHVANGGMPEYRKKNLKAVEDTLDALENRQNKNEDEMSDIDKAMMELRLMNMRELVHSPEGEYPYSVFWTEVLMQSKTPRKTYKEFKDNVDWLFFARHTFHFHFRPSLYAGQEIDARGLLKMAEATAAHLHKYQNEEEE